MDRLIIKPEMVLRLRWFSDSPNAGDPACKCSYCLKPIGANDLPIRAWSGSGATEIRLHMACARQVFEEGPHGQTG